MFLGNWKLDLNQKQNILEIYFKNFDFCKLYDENYFREIGQKSYKEIKEMTKNENFHDNDRKLIEESKVLDNLKISKPTFSKMKQSFFMRQTPKANFIILNKSVHSSEILQKTLKLKYVKFKLCAKVLEQVFYDKYLI